MQLAMDQGIISHSDMEVSANLRCKSLLIQFQIKSIQVQTNQGLIWESIHCNLTVVAQSIHVSPLASKFESNRPKIKPKLFFFFGFGLCGWVGGSRGWVWRSNYIGDRQGRQIQGYAQAEVALQCFNVTKINEVGSDCGLVLWLRCTLARPYGYFPRHYWYKLLPWISWMFLTKAW